VHRDGDPGRDDAAQDARLVVFPRRPGQELARSDGIYRGYLARAMDRIGETGALKPGLTHPRAVDIAWFYLGHESWHALAVARQWSWEETERWLADQLTAALLGAQ
jgi:hypothetical protein